MAQADDKLVGNLEQQAVCSTSRRCCGNFTKFEMCLIGVSLALLAGLLGTLACWIVITKGFQKFVPGYDTGSKVQVTTPSLRPVTPDPNTTTVMPESPYDMGPDSQKPVCTSKECGRIAGLFLQNLKDNVDPCDDFYEFACGNYPLFNVLQASKAFRHTIADTTVRLQKQLKSLLETKVETDKDPDWINTAKIYYQKCINENELTKTGVANVLKYIDELGGWPVLEGADWDSGNFSWEKALGQLLNKTGANSIIIETSINHDQKNSSYSVLEIDQPDFGMPGRGFYLQGPDEPSVRNYTTLMTEVAVGLGANRSVAVEDMRAVTLFEIELAKTALSEEVRRDNQRSYNPTTLAKLKTSYPKIDWQTYFDQVLPEHLDVNDNETIIVKELSYLSDLQKIMEKTPPRTVKNYIIWRFVNTFAAFLPMSVRSPFYKFKANLTGILITEPPDRWEECVQLATALMPLPVGAMWVDTFFDKETIPQMTNLATNMKEAFIGELRDLDWMDDRTKQHALEKTYKLEYVIAYPELLFNDSWMGDFWEEDTIKASEPLLVSSMTLKLKRVAQSIEKLRSPVDRTRWYQSPAQVDAYYAPSLNQMVFPAGIMQFPFLSPGVPNYVAFGMAGAVIGHEISHAFDDQGGQYDKNGNLKNWWDKTTEQLFKNKTSCLVTQYDNIEIPEAGIRINGRVSLGENIADNAGVKTAYKAYTLWAAKQHWDEPSLPGLQNYTNQQLFFLAYANNWCTMIRPEFYKQIVMTDVHAPSKFRTIVPLRNLPEFSEAFQCPAGSPMNPRRKCKVW